MSRYDSAAVHAEGRGYAAARSGIAGGHVPGKIVAQIIKRWLVEEKR